MKSLVYIYTNFHPIRVVILVLVLVGSLSRVLLVPRRIFVLLEIMAFVWPGSIDHGFCSARV
jgi:hypothetical protein